MCLYVNVLPLNTVLKVWDLIFLEGNSILFNIAFAIFALAEEKILKLNDFSQILIFLNKFPSTLNNPNQLIKIA